MNQTIKILQKVQAGILKSHGRDYMKCVFIRLNENLVEQQLIGFFKLFKPTSAFEQQQFSKTYKLCKKSRKVAPETIIQNIYISTNGLERIGYKSPYHVTPILENLSSIISETEDPINEKRDANFFWQTMRHSTNVDGDIPFNKWHLDYKQEFHLLITFAGDNLIEIEKKYSFLKCVLKDNAIGYIVHKEDGKTITKTIEGKKQYFEPFGYRDGISKINFFKNKKLIESQLPIVLDKSYGSFLVFRKLKQDVKGFRKKVLHVAGEIAKSFTNEIGLHPKKEVFINFVEGQIMGRYKNGVPISLTANPYKKRIPHLKSFNNFEITPSNFLGKGYEKDDLGEKCPIFAHIRKSNPRNGSLMNSKKNKPPRVIVRRSIPYVHSDDDQGILFMCFQRNIANQFKYIQSTWLNGIYGNRKIGGNLVDPISGGRKEQKEYPSLSFNTIWGKKGNLEIKFQDFVRLQGGEFFYAPPLSFFNKPMNNKIIKNKMKIN